MNEMLVESLADLDLDFTPPCGCKIWSGASYVQCGKPSAYRVRFSCNACQTEALRFWCEGCYENITNTGKGVVLTCGYCWAKNPGFKVVVI
jgi:predicted amidophosphoribosyltransferase